MSKPDRTPLALFPVRALWTLPLNTQLAVTAAPAYEGVRALIAIDDDRIIAYDLARGVQLWIAAAKPAFTPAVSPTLAFLFEPGRLMALSLDSGSTAWEHPFPESPAVAPVFDNGWLVVATIAGDVLAFRADDGTPIWRASTGSPAHAPAALAADRVYVPTEDGRVVAMRVDTGARLWEHRFGGAATNILALDDRLFVGSTDNFFYCLKADTGDEDWRWRTGADVMGAPIVDDRAVYFVSLDNVLWALNRSNGNQRWKRPLPLRPTAGPLRAGQTIVVSGFANQLPGYKTEDGQPAGDIPLSGELAAPPHAIEVPGVFGPVVVVTTRDIVKGATVTAVARSIDPPVLPAVAVLPNPVALTPPVKPPS